MSDSPGTSHAVDLIKKYSLTTNMEIRRALEAFAEEKSLEIRCFGFPREDGLMAPYAKAAYDWR